MPFTLTEIIKDPLSYFDAILRGHDLGLSSDEEPEAVAACLCAIAGYPSPPEINPIDSLVDSLDANIDRDNQNTLVACLLLSIWKLDNGWISDDRDLRRRVMGILEETLRKEYSTLKINEQDQTHHKLRDLANAVEEFDRNLKSALGEFTSLERINAYRQELQKVLRSGLGSHLLVPLMPHYFAQEINQAHAEVEEYLRNRDLPSMIDSYENAISSLRDLYDNLADVTTYYTQLIALSIESLKDSIQNDFESNKIAQPASLSIFRNNKKYPLSEIDKNIEVILEITNSGSGYAYDVSFVIVSDEALELGIITPITRISPQSTQLLYIPAQINLSTESVSLIVRMTWHNYGSPGYEEFEEEFILEAQRLDQPWDELEMLDPYSTEPIDSPDELYGRSSLINKLVALSNRTRRVGSAYVTGQKRVGKTSIAIALQDILQENGFVVAYFEGEFIQSTADETIQDLGLRICRSVQKQVPEAMDLNLPEFYRDLSPARDFLDQVIEVTDKRIIIILDEFDEISPELYSANDLSDSLFMALRNTSSRPHIGFILVGGEKLKLIVESKGTYLNKWKPFEVDYFDFTSDYREIVVKPAEDFLDFDDTAIRLIYESTAGNPYFTKMLCNYIYLEALERRDLSITIIEVERAIAIAVTQIRSNTFQHFWDDGIDKRISGQDAKKVLRRRLLIAVCDSTNSQGIAPVNLITNHKLVINYNRVQVEDELRAFEGRGVLVSDGGGEYRFKVSLFQKWLDERGTQDVLTTLTQDDVILQERKDDERLRVKPAEIRDLLSQWDTNYYKGKQVTAEDVRAWLSQFKLIREQRSMFNMLKSLKFYSLGFVREKLKEGHKSKLSKGLDRVMKLGQRKRDDIFVSYLVGEGKSGAELARLYAQECDINIRDCVIPRNKVRSRLEKRSGLNAIVFADDFIGSGNQLCGALRGLNHEISGIVNEHEIRVVVLIVVGTERGIQNVEATLSELDMDVELFVGEILGSEHYCFSDESNMYGTEDAIRDARDVALKYGKNLMMEFPPLGFDNQGLAVVFESNCPNNSLPILWYDGVLKDSEQTWLPLFKR